MELFELTMLRDFFETKLGLETNDLCSACFSSLLTVDVVVLSESLMYIDICVKGTVLAVKTVLFVAFLQIQLIQKSHSLKNAIRLLILGIIFKWRDSLVL